MIKITIPAQERYDEATNIFYQLGSDQTIMLEHSLLSLSKWESKWCKPFLETQMTTEETLDYIRCMTVTPNVNPDIYKFLTNKNIEDVNEYIKSPMTATWITEREGEKRGGRRIVTAELIYCWMITLQIPFDCEKWHLNRLLTLIRVCNEENKPKKKMSAKEAARQRSSLNAKRRAKAHSRG